MELRENREIKQNKAVIDLRGVNVLLKHKSKKLNGRIKPKRAKLGRFERIEPSELKGILIQALIYAKFGNLKRFAEAIGKSKSWVSGLIHGQEDINISRNTQDQMSEIFGVRILL